MSLPQIRYPQPAARIAPYVEVLGPELAIRFLLRFGSSEIHLSANPHPGSELAKMIGPERVRLLALRVSCQRVPLGNRWLAAAPACRGESTAEIARRLRATDTTVRGWLRWAEARGREGKPV